MYFLFPKLHKTIIKTALLRSKPATLVITPKAKKQLLRRFFEDFERSDLFPREKEIITLELT